MTTGVIYGSCLRFSILFFQCVSGRQLGCFFEDEDVAGDDLVGAAVGEYFGDAEAGVLGDFFEGGVVDEGAFVLEGGEADGNFSSWG